jgi:enoyl-CoA hydratase/carnithine racemase
LISGFFQIEEGERFYLLRLTSSDGMNRLTRACVVALTEAIQHIAGKAKPLVIAGNENYFSVGADLCEIAALTGPSAYDFSKMGQSWLNAIEQFSAPVIAAIDGYCMGGGLDLALACHRRIASPQAIFGHRGAALGLITGWGGTQRLPRLLGRAKGLQLLVAAERLHATEALKIGLVHAVVDNPVSEALKWCVPAG